ncbi:spore-associated protein A [Streptomyces sp. BBFR2]|uniref:spore-associated protein A n=1 Tax=Streptomyces sp. BBFR2 TaxID=3372854 RepID=UPI0037DA549D
MQRSRVLAGSAVLALAALTSLATTATASAAPAPKGATYNGACGSGYSVVNSAEITGKGTVFLTYSGTTGKNCVVTVRAATGSPVEISTYLGPSDGSSEPVFDDGLFTSYAGPVYLAAKGRCVDWGGAIENVSVNVNGTNCGKLAPGIVTHS